MNGFTLIGLAAGILTTSSLIPQVIKTIKTKSTKDLSLVMYVVLSLGVFLWLLYGILITDVPLIAANGITFLLCLIIVDYKIKYG